jgi:hypothetical protein
MLCARARARRRGSPNRVRAQFAASLEPTLSSRRRKHDDRHQTTMRHCRDLSGNEWWLHDDGSVGVRPCGSSTASELEGPSPALTTTADDESGTAAEPSAACSLAADYSGYVWLATPSTLYRLDPREAEPLWLWVGCIGVEPLPATGSIASIAPANGDDARVVVTTSSGSTIRVDVTEPAEPPTLVAQPGPEAVHPWQVLSRMPCSNHDIFLCEAAGKIWIAGGLTNHRGFPAERHVFAELFHWDPRTDVWGSVRMPLPLAYCGLAALAGRVYVVGGHTPPDDVPQTGVQVFDTSTSSWVDVACPALPESRMECNAATAGGRLFVIGGSSGGSAGGALGESVQLASTISWAPGESSWREEAPAPAEIRQFGTAVIDDVIWCCGGMPGQFTAFDSTARTWLAGLAPHPMAPQAPLVGAHNGELWVCGGARQRAVHRYVPSTGSWHREPDLPTDQSWGAAYSWGGRLLVAGGAHIDDRVGNYVFDDRVFALTSEQHLWDNDIADHGQPRL